MPFPTFATQAEVPEAFRDGYEERDGKWQPKAAAAPPADDTLGEKGKKALKEEREAREAEKRRADKAEADLAELKRTEEAKKTGVTEEQLKKIRDDEAAARKPIEDKAAALEAENKKLKLTDRVKALWLKNGGFGSREEDAMIILGLRADLDAKGEGIVFKDRDGNVTADDAEAFFKKFRTEKPWLFTGTGASGSGAEGSDTDTSTSDAATAAAKAGKEAAKRQKMTAEDNKLAFT